MATHTSSDYSVANESNPSNPMDVMNHISKSYDENSSDYKFHAIMYNKPPENVTIKQYVKPDNVLSYLWDQSNRQNPDPNHLTPVFLKGFHELKNRAERCETLITTVRKKEHELSEKIKEIKREHARTKMEIGDIRRDQVLLTLNVLQITRAITMMNNSTNKRPLTNNELVLRGRLKRIRTELDRRTQKFNAKSNDILTAASVPSNTPHKVPLHLDKIRLKQWVREQQKYITDLVDHVQKDTKDLKELMTELKINKKRKEKIFSEQNYV